MADGAFALPAEVSMLLKEGALFVANHSGGKDSQAMLIELLKRVPREHLIVVHATLGEVELGGSPRARRKTGRGCRRPLYRCQGREKFPRNGRAPLRHTA